MLWGNSFLRKALAMVDIETFCFNPLLSAGERETWEAELWRRKGATITEEGRESPLRFLLKKQRGWAVREAISNGSGMVIYQLGPRCANWPHRGSAYMTGYALAVTNNGEKGVEVPMILMRFRHFDGGRRRDQGLG